MRKNKVEMNDLIIENIEKNEEKNEKKSLKSKGRPKKNEDEKAKNVVNIYLTDEEVERIKKATILNGLDEKKWKLYSKQALLKSIRRELDF